MVFRCIFYGNSFRLPQQCSVFIAAGVCRIEDCQITSQSGGGIRRLLIWFADSSQLADFCCIKVATSVMVTSLNA